MPEDTAPAGAPAPAEAATPTEAPAAPTQEAAPAAPPTESAAAAEEAPAEPTFAEIMTDYGTDESPHREALSRYNDEQQGQGWQRALDTLQPHINDNKVRTEANAKLYTEASQQLATMNGRVDKAVKDGILTEESLSDAIKSVPGAWSALQAIGEERQTSSRKTGQEEGIAAGTWQAAQIFVEQGAKAIGRPSLHQKYSQRLEGARQGREDSVKVIHDFVKDIRQGGYEDGLASKNAENTETTNVADRKNQRPPQGVGSVGGAKDDNARLMDPTTPVAELIEIRNRQQAG